MERTATTTISIDKGAPRRSEKLMKWWCCNLWWKDGPRIVGVVFPRLAQSWVRHSNGTSTKSSLTLLLGLLEPRSQPCERKVEGECD
jgi:hypothetical protein